jgi:hypothetical protein
MFLHLISCHSSCAVSRWNAVCVWCCVYWLLSLVFSAVFIILLQIVYYTMWKCISRVSQKQVRINSWQALYNAQLNEPRDSSLIIWSKSGLICVQLTSIYHALPAEYFFHGKWVLIIFILFIWISTSLITCIGQEGCRLLRIEYGKAMFKS